LSIDFSLLTNIAEKIILLFAGGLVGRFFERRARVVVFYSHVGQFRLQSQQQPGLVHTHSVVIRNAGRIAAHNVHVPLGCSMPPTFIFQLILISRTQCRRSRTGPKKSYFPRFPPCSK
jgi:hypothetical protein